MARINLAAEKRAANERYADKFRRKTSRKHLRKAARRARTEARELRVLQLSGIPRDEKWPLV